MNGVANIQTELMTNGPIPVAFMVYERFMSYKSGVHQKGRFESIPEGGQSGVHQKGLFEFIPEGGHVVKLVGRSTAPTAQSSSSFGRLAPPAPFVPFKCRHMCCEGGRRRCSTSATCMRGILVVLQPLLSPFICIVHVGSPMHSPRVW